MDSDSDAIKVRLNGQNMWWMKDVYAAGPLELEVNPHINAEGILVAFGVSYAHVYETGEITRRGQLIGHRDDLVMNWA